MGQTPIYGLRFPQPSDPNNVPRDMRNLAEDVEGELSRVDSEISVIESEISAIESSITADAILALLDGRIPGQRIATTEVKADSPGTTTTDIQVMSVVPDLGAGRTYRVWVDMKVASTSADDIVQCRIRNLDTTDQLQIARIVVGDGADTGYPVVMESEFTPLVDGPQGFSATLQRHPTGDGTVRMRAGDDRPAYLYVDYIRG